MRVPVASWALLQSKATLTGLILQQPGGAVEGNGWVADYCLAMAAAGRRGETARRLARWLPTAGLHNAAA